MSKKKNNSESGLVYSTNPDFKLHEEDLPAMATLIPSQQKLKVRLDKQHRAGKVVTLITGFEGKEEDMQDLAKKVKSFCGTGGSVKDNEIIIQGNNIEKILQWLLKNGYSGAKKN